MVHTFNMVLGGVRVVAFDTNSHDQNPMKASPVLLAYLYISEGPKFPDYIWVTTAVVV